MGQGDDGVIVDARHGLGGNHGIDYGFFGGLDSREKNRIEGIVGEHGELVQALAADGTGIRRGESDEDVSGAVAGIAAVAAQARERFSWRRA